MEKKGYKREEYKWVVIEGWVSESGPVCQIIGLSDSCPLLSVGDDNGDKLRGVGHAMESGRKIVDVVQMFSRNRESGASGK